MQSNPPGSCRSFIPGLSPPPALYRVNLTSWANMINLLGSVVRQGLEHFIQPLPLRVTGGRVGSTLGQSPDLRRSRINLRNITKQRANSSGWAKSLNHLWVWPKVLPPLLDVYKCSHLQSVLFLNSIALSSHYKGIALPTSDTLGGPTICLTNFFLLPSYFMRKSSNI